MTQHPAPIDNALFDQIEVEQLRGRVFGSLFGEADPVQIGRYTVSERIGSGGMGVVYAAHDSRLGRKLAIKVLHGAGASSAEARARLLREAQALARLSHPNVVQIHDVGEADGRVFIAMEFVRGRTLREWIDQERPSTRQILALMQQAAGGLAAAHEAGIVHRDVKPENILVSDRGRALVVDFGVAFEEASGELVDAPAHSPSNLALTRTGALVGTPAYMAPEQLEGTASPSTDQFAFGVTLFEALHGARPFRGETLGELTAAIKRGRVVATPGSRIPRFLGKVLRRTLNPDPSARFASMSDVAKALQTRRFTAAGALWVLAGCVLAYLFSMAAVGFIDGLQQASAEPNPPSEFVGGAEEDREREAVELHSDAVLREARMSLDADPTRSAALLTTLHDAGWTEEALNLGATAMARGVAYRVIPMEYHFDATVHPDQLAEFLDAGAQGQPPRKRGGFRSLADSPFAAQAKTTRRIKTTRHIRLVTYTRGRVAEVLRLNGAKGTTLVMAADYGEHALTYRDAYLGFDNSLHKIPNGPISGAMTLSWAGDVVAYHHRGYLVVLDSHGKRRRVRSRVMEELRFSEDGRWLAGVDDKGALHLYTADLDLIKRDTGVDAIGPRFDPQGTRVVAWDKTDESTRVSPLVSWALPSGKRTPLRAELDPTQAARLSFTADGALVLAETRDGEVSVLSSEGGAYWRPRSAKPVSGAALIRGGKELVTAHHGELRVWRIPPFPSELPGHEQGVWNIGITPDGRMFSRAQDKTVRRWDLAEAQGAFVELDEAWLAGVAVGPGGPASIEESPWTAAVTEGGEIVWSGGRYAPRVFNPTQGVAADLECPFCSEYRWGAIGVSPDGRYVATLSDRIRVWDREAGQEHASFAADVSGFRLGWMDVANGGDRVLLHRNNELYVCDARQESVWEGESTANLRHVRLLPDGRVVEVSASDGVAVLDPATGLRIPIVAGRPREPTALAVGPDGATVYVGDQGGTIYEVEIPPAVDIATVRNAIETATNLDAWSL